MIVIKLGVVKNQEVWEEEIVGDIGGNRQKIRELKKRGRKPQGKTREKIGKEKIRGELERNWGKSREFRENLKKIIVKGKSAPRVNKEAIKPKNNYIYWFFHIFLEWMITKK